ncbi:MAG: putative ABC transporter permease [Coriobacteriaceae bacterium]|nr:putative ABC transporter permease [Coriobacteriaceae bacterium]
MLLALLSLFLLFGLIRIIWRAVNAFLAWLGRGKLVHELAEGDLIEEEYAEDIRQSIKELDEQSSLKELGKEIKGEAPKLTREQRRAIRRASYRARDEYLSYVKLGWYQIVVIFLVASFLGLIIEQIWMFITEGLTESRVGLVWGPYSPIYGFGAVLLTLVCWKLREKGAKAWQIFVVGMIVGGLLEQITGLGMETFLGAVSWDYTGVPGAITKWVAWPFLFFWGALGLLWAKAIMPELLYRIGNPTTVRQVVFVSLLAIYLTADIGMTAMCFGRMAARDEGIAPRNDFEEWVDENYTDEFIAARFQNMAINGMDGAQDE